MARNRERKLKRKKQRREKRLVKRVDRFATPSFGVLQPFPTSRKMSDALNELVWELIPNDASREELERALDFGKVAWNIALLPAAEREKEVSLIYERAVTEMGLAGAEKFLAILQSLIQRKLDLFPDDSRKIVEYYVTTLPDGGLYMNVVFVYCL